MLARQLAEEDRAVEAARAKLADGEARRLSDFGRLDRHGFQLFLNLLGEALPAQTNPDEAVERVTGDGLLHVRLEPLAADSNAEIRTDTGMFSGRDHLLTITTMEARAMPRSPLPPVLARHGRHHRRAGQPEHRIAGAPRARGITGACALLMTPLMTWRIDFAAVRRRRHLREWFALAGAARRTYCARLCGRRRLTDAIPDYIGAAGRACLACAVLERADPQTALRVRGPPPVLAAEPPAPRLTTFTCSCCTNGELVTARCHLLTRNPGASRVERGLSPAPIPGTCDALYDAAAPRRRAAAARARTSVMRLRPISRNGCTRRPNRSRHDAGLQRLRRDPVAPLDDRI